MLINRFFRPTLTVFFLTVFFTIYATAQQQAVPPRLQTALDQRQENALNYEAIRDTMSVNTWGNLMRLIHHLQRIASADSVIQTEYADLFSQQLKNNRQLEGKLDSLAGQIGKGSNTSGYGESPMLYIGLIGLTAVLAGLGGYLLWLLFRGRHRHKPVAQVAEGSELQQTITEYENKLAEIGQVLAELTGEREKTSREIEELTKALHRERSQRTTYAEHYEKLTIEHNHLKVNLETLLKENSLLKRELSEPSASTVASPDAAAFITEIEMLHAQLAAVNDEKNQLASDLSQLQNSLSSKHSFEEAARSEQLMKENGQLKEALSHSENSLELAKSENRDLSNDQQSLREKNQQLIEALNDARLSLGQQDALAEALRNQVASLAEKLSNYERLQAEFNELKMTAQQTAWQLEQLTGIESELNQVRSQLAEKEKELEKKKTIENELKRVLSGL